jgi:hypothetical protein
MKRIVVFVLVAALVLLAGCGEVALEESSAATTTEAPTTIEALITIEESTTLSFEYPISYKYAPEGYKPVLDEFYRHVQMVYVEDGEAHITGEGEYLVEPWFSTPGDLGYAIEDINNDGIPELLLLNLTNFGWGSSEEPFIHALFTLKDDQPVQLGQYWRRDHAQLGADGTVYRIGSGGADSWYLTSYMLETGAAELTLLTEYWKDFDDEGKNVSWQGPWDGKQEPISDKEFNRLFASYDKPPNPMKLNFIPIKQGLEEGES